MDAGSWASRSSSVARRLRRVLRPGDEMVVVPAIVGEGCALHAAVSAQGIAGMLARRRSSPYLPGVRSRLWRSIAAATAVDTAAAEKMAAADETAASGGGGTAEGTGDTPGGAETGEPAAAATAPVLALFRRLPLDDVASD